MTVPTERRVMRAEEQHSLYHLLPATSLPEQVGLFLSFCSVVYFLTSKHHSSGLSWCNQFGCSSPSIVPYIWSFSETSGNGFFMNTMDINTYRHGTQTGVTMDGAVSKSCYMITELLVSLRKKLAEQEIKFVRLQMYL